VLVEIIDDGAASAPVVKGDLYAAEGHGLFLVQNMATERGYQRDEAGTTVWFHLPVTHQPGPADRGQDPPVGQGRPAPADLGPDPAARQVRPAQFWAAATPSATSA
jgi:hypothetical protein